MRVLVFFISILIATANVSCIKNGCTATEALNFDPKANNEDGSCEYSHGCNDEGAVNYDPNAGLNDGSCLYYGHLMFWTANYIDFIVIIDSLDQYGPNPGYANYEPSSCNYSNGVRFNLIQGRYHVRIESWDGNYLNEEYWIDLNPNQCYIKEVTLD